MNNKQRSSNDEPNRNSNPANERQLAQHTARMLELQPLESQSKDDQATAELGSLLRDAAQANLPDSSLDLREQLMAELDGGAATPESDQVASKEVASSEVSSRSTGRRFWVAAAASGLLLVGGTIAYSSGFVGTLSNVAVLDKSEQPNVEAVADRSAPIAEPQTPEVVFRMETKTREVPITRMSTQTKTRTVPVQKVRDEIRQVKQADGSIKTETVKVPYTEQVTPSYTVQVPIQDVVTQSYQVPVPYTADGKRIEKSDYGKYGLKCDDRGGITQGLKDEKLVTRLKAIEVEDLDEDFEEELESAAIELTLSDGLTDVASLTEGQRFALEEPDVRLPEFLSPTFTELGLKRSLASGSGLGNKLSGRGRSTGDPEADFGGAVPSVSRESVAGLRPLKTGMDTDGRFQPGSDLDKDRRSQGGRGMVELRDNAQQIANETRIVEELELQRDQLTIVRKYGPGHAQIGALNSAIKERKGKIEELSVAPAGDAPTDEQLEHYWLAEGKSAIEGTKSPEDSSRPAEFMSGGEVPFRVAETSQGSGSSNGPARPTVTMFNGQSGSGVQPSQPGSSLIGTPVMQGLKTVRFEPSADLGKNGRSQGFQGEQDYFELNSGGEQYEPIFENAFIAAKGLAASSTFSIDVDTASYANMRRMLNSGQRPPPNSIRLEELVNYFQYDYAQPTGDHPFSVNLELADCPWQPGQQLLRVALKGKDIDVGQRPPTNVVFLIDVSGSMSSNDKLPLLKSGFQMMSRQLGENDRVSIVTYAGNAGVALEPTNGTQTSTINTAIERLASGGSTHGSAGIKLAYELAQKNFIQGGVNRVMLATDGDLNVGVTSDDALVTLIKEKAAEGVFLTVLGFGGGNLKDAKLEKLADNGNGMYAYIDSTREAHRVLVDQLSGSLVTIAKDVKIQVVFNPAEVKSYRLLGYENRMLETKDFDDDAKDAGEIGAGHTVTAIYQIEPAKAVSPNVSVPAGMKYQVKSDAGQASVVDVDVDKDGLSKAAFSGELATVALRYKQPDASESERLEVSIKNQAKRFEEASADFRFAAGVAGFGMYLRNSEHRGSIDAGMLQRIASESIGKDESGYRSEFIDLIRRASNR